MEKLRKEEIDEAFYNELSLTNYPKSNLLIGAKYRSSLLENKILAIALSKIANAMETNEGLVLYLKASDLRMMMGKNSGSFYRDLDRTANEMTGRTVGISDPKQRMFDYIAVITRAKYEKGELKLVFNSALKEHLRDLTGNFTKLNLLMMLLFESTFSFRLYELLKSKAFIPGNKVDETKNMFMISFGLSELKLSLGIVNAELDVVRRELRSKTNPNFDRAVDISPEKKYLDWTKLRLQVLDPAIKEINEKTDITVDYTPSRSGKGGKVVGINFVVRYNNRATMSAETLEKYLMESANVRPEKICFESILSNDDTKIQIEKVYRMWDIETPIDEEDILAILKAANYNYYVVYKTYKLMVESSQTIKDPIAYMISGCKKNYVPSENAIQQALEVLGISEDSDDSGQMKMDFS